MRIVLWLVLVLLPLAGCQTAAHHPKTSDKDTVSALSTVTQGLTNKPLTEAELRNLAVQAQKNPEAKSALRSINSALSPVYTVKYCPENGERFSADMMYCPDGKVKLEWVE